MWQEAEADLRTPKPRETLISEYEASNRLKIYFESQFEAAMTKEEDWPQYKNQPQNFAKPRSLPG